MRRLGQRLGRPSQRLLELVAHRAEVDAERPGAALDRDDELLGVDPVAVLRRHAAGGGVRVAEQTERLELGELATYGGRGHVEARPLDERLRPDRLPGRDVLLDDASQDLALARRQLHSAHRTVVSRRTLASG